MDFRVTPGTESTRHVHQNEDELYYILDGEAEFVIGNQTHAAFPGTLVFVPRGTPHHLKVQSGCLRALLILTPPGFERFLIEHSTDARSLSRPPVGPSVARATGNPSDALRRYGFELIPDRI